MITQSKPKHSWQKTVEVDQEDKQQTNKQVWSELTASLTTQEFEILKKSTGMQDRSSEKREEPSRSKTGGVMRRSLLQACDVRGATVRTHAFGKQESVL